MKRVSVLGSTGSVGRKAVNLIQKSENNVILLTGHSNVELLAQQAIDTKCEHVYIHNESLFRELKELLAGTKTNVHSGGNALSELLSINVDMAVNCITGFVGVPITFHLVNSQIPHIAIANKESIICGGSILQKLAHDKGVKILPMDSEHSSIFRILEGNNKSVSSITITASGGPFLNSTIDEMHSASPEKAAVHPIWKMGKKISIDSATMMNKSLEILEAYYLFGMKADVVIHPESIVHGVVHYTDGTMVALCHCPDMIFPIAYALSWPNIPSLSGVTLNSILEMGRLSFMKPDYKLFPALKIGYDVLSSCDTHKNSIVMNAANEVAVEAFLNGKIHLTEIPVIVEETLSQMPAFDIKSVLDIISLNTESRFASKRLLHAQKVYINVV